MLAPRRTAWLRHTAVLTVVAFGLQACGTWKTVPLANVESGQQALTNVDIHFKEKASGSFRTVHVQAVRFPYVEGTEGNAEEGYPLTQVKVDLREVDSLEVYDPRTGLTIVAVVGVILGIIAVVALIVALTKKSCPFVYLVTAEGAQLVGEAYSGAITRATQRPDLMPLPPLRAGRAHLVLANEAMEAQYTDQLDLWLVDHGPDVRAVATSAAGVLLVGPPRTPTQVTDLSGTDVTRLVTARDGQLWQTDLDRAATAATPPVREGLVATFPPPGAGSRRVLELEAGNTPWMDLVFGRFFALFGDSLGAYLASGEDPASAPRARAWREREGVDLSVEVFRAGHWEQASFIAPLGPVSLRHVAVPLPPLAAGESVRVRLTGAIGFWRVDDLALSELRTAEPAKVRVAPAEARQNDGADVRALLASLDGQYQVLPRAGDKVDLVFQFAPPAPGIVRDAFLFTSGYYLVDASPNSAQSLETLRTLREEPQSLSRFSLDLYRKYREMALAQK